MKIGTIRKLDGQPDSIIEIGTGTVLSGVTLTGLFGSVIAILTLWFIDLPKIEFDKELQVQLMQFDMINVALRSGDDTTRKASLKILIESGLIKDANDSIISIATSVGSSPDWRGTPIFKSSLVKSGGFATNGVNSSHELNELLNAFSRGN